MNTAQLDTPTAAALPGLASACSPADWTQAQLLQHVTAHQAQLGVAGVIGVYQLWLEYHPGAQGAVARFNLGTALQTAGRWQEAERQYRALLASVDLAQARHNLALLLDRAGSSDQALAQWQHVAASNADTPLRLLALAAAAAVARRTGRHDALQNALACSLRLDPAQPALRAELERLGRPQVLRADPPADPPADLVVCVVAPCFNEALMLPFFLDHYLHHVGATKIVLLDDGSTDGTAEIAARYPQVTFVSRPTDSLDDRDLLRKKNEGWKPYRDGCDWMIVCDIDEFLYHPDMRRVLRELKRDGITLPQVEGFNMISKAYPQHRAGRYLWQDWQSGWPDRQYMNKQLIFDPRLDINYTLGCHNCQPTGPVQRSADYVFKNLHMCMPSHGHVVQRARRSAARMSDWNNQLNIGFHYKVNAEMNLATYNAKFLAAGNVVEPRERPAPCREGFEPVRQFLLARAADARVLELGVARGFGAQADSGSTEFLAWYVHAYGGALHSVDGDARARRHVQLELARRGLWTGRVTLTGPEALSALRAAGACVDLVYVNACDQYGDADDRGVGQREALTQVLDIAPLLAPTALVVLDGGRAACEGEGRFALLAALLQGQGWRAEFGVDTVLLQRAV